VYFNLVHVIPHPRMHGLNGYKEVIDTVAWGLKELGHEATYTLNAFSHSAINIIFGAQVMEIEDFDKLRDNTIVYNFEQMRGHSHQVLRKQLHFCAERFQIWDYSEFNLDTWSTLNPKFPVRHVPVSYSPVLDRGFKPQQQDFDVFIYGTPGPERLSAFSALSQVGISCVFASGLYGIARDELIAKARIVLNVTFYQTSRIFEIVRVSYLLANAKAVVSVTEEGLGIEDGLANAVRFCTSNNLVATVEELLADVDARQKLEKAAFDFMIKRDIRPILRQALGDSS
jgi:hypothetical protein